MPTDPNNLIQDQTVAIRDQVTCVDRQRGTVFTGYGAIAIADIITDWPPAEPSADDAGWEYANVVFQQNRYVFLRYNRPYQIRIPRPTPPHRAQMGADCGGGGDVGR